MNISIGTRVKTWREHRGISGPELAAEVGISRQAIHQIEQRGSAKIATIELIAKAFGVSMQRFFGPLPRGKSS